MKADPSCPKGMHPRTWEAICEEHKQEFISELVGRIKQGSRKSGVRLTASERWVIVQMLQPKPKRLRGRPAADWDQICEIARYCCVREWRSETIEDAVAETAKAFQVSPATVWKARAAYNDDSS
jgi:hypothetical protein